MPNIDGLFACGYDVIVFVDEGEAGPVADDSSRLVVGRAVSRADRREVRELSRLLAEEHAETWHASKRGAASMFTSARLDELVSGLNALMTSVLFDLRSTPQDLLALRDNYRGIISNAPELSDDWPDARRVGHEQLLLFAFLVRLGVQVAWRQSQGEPPGTRSLVACDRQSWWSKGRGWYRGRHPAVRERTRGGYVCEVRSLLDKEAAEAVHVLRWLGLVDSELWAIAGAPADGGTASCAGARSPAARRAHRRRCTRPTSCAPPGRGARHTSIRRCASRGPRR